MVIKIPNKLYRIYKMKERYAIIKENAKIYQKGSKKLKTQILNELQEILGMNRQYLSFLLRNTGKKVVIKKGGLILVGEYSPERLSRRGRKKVYTEDIEKVLFKIWVISGFISSKHLVHYIRINKDLIFSHPELKKYFIEEVKEKLLKISAATVDRILKKYRQKWKLKKKYKGNPYSSNLKRSIQVESWFDKEKEPGYLEIDLVHHSGKIPEGQFIYTLTATDIYSGWTTLIPLRNKAMLWTMEALKEVVKNMPVKIKKLHTNNGSEFINSFVKKFCQNNNIEFTRNRPYRKNDAPYVESKNWSMVRRYTGWNRYDTEEEYQILKKLTKLISIRHNLYLPEMKVIEKQRIGGKVKKKYKITTPLNRILELNDVDDKIKEKLKEMRNSIDIVKLTEAIFTLKEKLFQTYQSKRRKEKCTIEI